MQQTPQNEQSELTEEADNLQKEILSLSLKVKNNKNYVNKINKALEMNQNDFIYDDNYYTSLVFNKNDDDTIENLDIEIEFVETKKQKDIWKYFKVNTSSIKTNDGVGRSIKMLVKDKITNKYLGILKIGSDAMSIAPRDKYIGWQRKDKTNIIESNGQRRINYLVNVRCCVGLQPVAYNFNVGKLLILLCFSKEVQEYFKKKYGHYIAGITTFSIYGKSIQYDRLKNIKFIGFTKGEVPDLPDKLYERLVQYLKNLGYDMSVFNSMSNSKIRKIQCGLRELELNVNILNNEIQRGIYFGFTGKDSKDFLCCKKDDFTPDLNSCKNITNWWKNRWAKNRYEHLKKTNRLKNEIDLLSLRKRALNNYRVNLYYEKLKQKIGEKAFKELKNKYAREYYEKKQLEGHIVKINSGICNIDLDPRYLGGLYDGDGTVTIHRTTSGYQLKVAFYQSVVNILEVLQKKYGGHIYKATRKRENQRREYFHIVRGENCEPLLRDLEKGCIMKYEKVKIAQEFLKLINKPNDEKKYELYDKIRKLNSEEEISYIKPYQNINTVYIAGLFDAEGYIGINRLNNMKFTITQDSDHNILYCIKDFLGFGNVYKASWYNNNAKKLVPFINEIKDYLIVKKVQVEYGLEFLDTIINKNGRNMTELREIRSKLNKLITDDKHTNIEIDYEEIKNENKKQKELKSSIENDIKEINKMKNKEEAKVKMSVAKMGLKNPNYGKKLNNKHSTNIAKSMYGKNRVLTDDDIDEIFELYDNKKYKRKNIAELYNVSRQTIDDVINKKIVKLVEIAENMDSYVEEKKQEKEEIKSKYDNMTDKEIINAKNKQTSISKRTLTIDQMIEILKLKGTMPSTKVKNSVSFKNKKGDDISETIVKNLWSGKTVIFEEEFANRIDMNYDEYKEIISKKNKISPKERNNFISKNKRTLTIEQIIDVLKIMRENKGKSFKERMTYKDMLIYLHDKYGENGGNNNNKITLDTVKKVKTLNIGEEEFTDKEITYGEYRDIITN